MKTNLFDNLVSEYEAWFEENKTLFQSELLALQQVIPVNKKGLEIGIGSGIFAKPLGIQSGVDPSENMLEKARERGLDVRSGVAENLPYDAESFDYAVMITSICFVNNPEKAVSEAYHVLREKGELIIAIIDRETPFGKFLDERKGKSRFYKYARFFSANEVITLLEAQSFKISRVLQTLEDPASLKIDNPSDGHGKGSFVVIKGVKG